MAGKASFDAAGLAGRFDPVGDGARGHRKYPLLGPRIRGPDALQAGCGGGREVGNMAARFLVGLRARHMQPPRAIGLSGQVLSLQGGGFTAAQEAIAE